MEITLRPKDVFYLVKLRNGGGGAYSKGIWVEADARHDPKPPNYQTWGMLTPGEARELGTALLTLADLDDRGLPHE